jgi:ribulose-bisphosphate carboxylase large chain
VQALPLYLSADAFLYFSAMSERFLAVYRFETAHPVEAAAEILAREQSTGTFVPLPGETEALKKRFGARVEWIKEEDTVPDPSLPGARPPSRYQGGGYKRALAAVSFPLENIGPSLPNLVATVAGGVYDLGQFSGMRLVDLVLPPAFAEAYGGPRNGPEGTRRLAGIQGRPLIGTIMKPSVGMSPDQTARIVEELAEAGLDFIKDDECMANPPHSPLKERVGSVMRAVHKVADKTGRKLMYAFNITDDLEAMLRHQDTVREAGGTCVMVSINPVGLVAFCHLRRHCDLPIHAHRNGWAVLGRHPLLGMDFKPFQLLWRLAGVDHMHCSGIRNKFWESDEQCIEAARACLDSSAGVPPAMPVFAAGQWAGQTVDTYRALGSVDLIYLCGGGIIGHPEGARAGYLSVRQGWEAALAGQSLQEYAQSHLELRQALEKFGG